jgi:hypothetical protein
VPEQTGKGNSRWEIATSEGGGEEDNSVEVIESRDKKLALVELKE